MNDSTIYDWSKDPALNASVDIGIDWREGQLPSTINDSARMMMSRIKQCLEERGGIYRPKFFENCYYFEIPFNNFVPGRLIRFLAERSNAGPTKIRFSDHNYSYDIYKCTDGDWRKLDDGDILQKNIHTLLLYNDTTTGYNIAFLLDPCSVNLTIGMICLFKKGSVPPLWLVCDGRMVLFTHYKKLYYVLNQTSSEPSGGCFYLPNLVAPHSDYCYAIKI